MRFEESMALILSINIKNLSKLFFIQKRLVYINKICIFASEVPITPRTKGLLTHPNFRLYSLTGS